VKITRIIWLHGYVSKIETKHGVYRDEIRYVLLTNPRIRRVAKGKRRKGEHLYAAYGQTEAGRYLIIFFIHRAGNEALVISARDMDGKERRQYGRK
jgi:uncharacterized DUF497 family protein